jgi:hypothetical protein
MLDQLTVRIAKMAELAAREVDDSMSPELYAIERALLGAKRRLERIVRGR